MRKATGETSNRFHLLGVPQFLLELHPLRHIVSDKEVLPLLFNPHSGPGKFDNPPVLVMVSGNEVARNFAATGKPHFIAGRFEIFAINEVRSIPALPFGRQVTKNCRDARAHSN